MSPLDIDPVTGAPIVTKVPDNANHGTDSSGPFVIPNGTLGQPGNAQDNSAPINIQTGTDESKLRADSDKTKENIIQTANESTKAEELASATLTPPMADNPNTNSPNEHANPNAIHQVESTDSQNARRREAQLRAIDRVLRLGGMDSQQADKAIVEIRSILSS